MAFGIKFIPLSPGGCDFASRMNGTPTQYTPRTPSSNSITREYLKDVEKQMEATRKQLNEIPLYSPMWESPEEFLEELARQSEKNFEININQPFQFADAEFLLDSASDVSMDSSDVFELPDDLLPDFDEPSIFQELPESGEYVDFSALDESTLETFQKQFEEFDRMFPPPDLAEVVAIPSDTGTGDEDIKMDTNDSESLPSTSNSPPASLEHKSS